MSLLFRRTDFKQFSVLLRFYSTKKKNYYEILQLQKNCTDKEIKEAFIQMSKTYHPDKNKNVKAQEHFVNIVEAYNILGKPSSRARYDSTVEINATYNNPDYWKPHVPYNMRRTQYDYGFYNESNASNTKSSSKNDAPYGVAGIKRLPNFAIVILCFAFAMVGMIIQVFVIQKSFHIQQKKADEHTKQLAQELDKVRASALENGNELQTKLILEKIVTASNPNVATATLGQALAQEKKNSKEMLAELKTEPEEAELME